MPVGIGLAAVWCTMLAPTGAGQDGAWLAPLVVPPGFEISVFADDAQAHSIHSLTFDGQGRCVVSGPGYVKILEDLDRDGRCDRVKLFAEVGPGGLHGMLFVGRTLYGVDDRGVVRLPDADGDDRADRSERIGPTVRRAGEHGPHGIVLGPDGWLYVVFGNQSRFRREHLAGPHSPVLNPVQGNIVRMTLSGDRCQAVTTGFRNPYDLAFNAAGELFTVDSDNEGELGLPFFRFPRLVHAVPGIDVGWRDTDEQWSDFLMDTAWPVCDMGRGSPTGLVVYDHTQFPDKYRGAVLAADWSWARIVAFFPKRDGAGWTATREDLVRTAETITSETHGERDYAVGFYPTDLEVAPDGSVYIALGGRDTLGVVYRLRFPDGHRDPETHAQTAVGHESRRATVLSTTAPARARLTAMRQLVGEANVEALPADFLRRAGRSGLAEVRAFVADAVRVGQQSELAGLLVRLTDDPDPLVRRRALEAWPAAKEDASFIAAVVERLGDPERLCRHAAARALEHIDASRWRSAAEHHPAHVVRLWATLVDTWKVERALSAPAYGALIETCLDPANPNEPTLEALRVLQHLLDKQFVSLRRDGDRHERALLDRLLALYPAANARINRELVNILAAHAPDDALAKLQSRLESNDPRMERLHVLTRLARMDVSWRGDSLRRLVRAWLELATKPSGASATSVGAVQARWLQNSAYWSRFCRDEPAVVVDALLEANRYTSLLTRPLGQLTPDAFDAVWPALRQRYVRLDESVRRTVLGHLGRRRGADAAAFLRQQVNDLAVRAAALQALKRVGNSQDHALFVRSVADDDLRVAEAAVDAIDGLDIRLSVPCVFDLINHLARTVDRPERRRFRNAILVLLEARSEDPPTRRRLTSARDEMQMVLDWQEWFDDTHPNFDKTFPPLRDPRRTWVDRRNVAGELLRRVDWTRGVAAAGEKQFGRLGCNKCHVHTGQGRALGPDLTGVGKRLSRPDLMNAIVRPSMAVPPRYQYTLFRLRDDTIVGGVVEQQVGDVLRIVTGAAEAVEVRASDIVDRAPQARSLMPTGALDPASDQDIADLFAFLATGEPPENVDGGRP